MEAEQYPEHEKLQLVKDRSQAVGEFIEWLLRNYSICQWQDEGNNGLPYYVTATEDDLLRIGEESGSRHSWEVMQARTNGIRNPEYESWPEGYYPERRSITDWLADYFTIDQQKLDDEKRQMLEAIRASYEAREAVNG